MSFEIRCAGWWLCIQNHVSRIHILTNSLWYVDCAILKPLAERMDHCSFIHKDNTFNYFEVLPPIGDRIHCCFCDFAAQITSKALIAIGKLHWIVKGWSRSMGVHNPGPPMIAHAAAISVMCAPLGGVRSWARIELEKFQTSGTTRMRAILVTHMCW